MGTLAGNMSRLASCRSHSSRYVDTSQPDQSIAEGPSRHQGAKTRPLTSSIQPCGPLLRLLVPGALSLSLASHQISLPPQDHQVAHQDRQGVLHIVWQHVDVVPLPPSSPEQQHPRQGSVPLSADAADVVLSVGSSGTSRKRGTGHIHTALLLEDGGSAPAPVRS
jgi:hypothetical protein